MLDSSAWIEILGKTSRASLYEIVFDPNTQLIVPSICIFEVCKFLAQVVPEMSVREARRLMEQSTIANLDATLAADAAERSRSNRLPMADAIIYATAQHHGAELWTQDAHFQKLPGVRYFAKP